MTADDLRQISREVREEFHAGQPSLYRSRLTADELELIADMLDAAKYVAASWERRALAAEAKLISDAVPQQKPLPASDIGHKSPADKIKTTPT